MPQRDADFDPASEPLAGGVAVVQALGRVREYLLAMKRRVPKELEAVHQLRVATRRGNAALDLFADSLDGKEARRWKRRLRKIRRAAGHARDLDVLLQRQYEQAGASKRLLQQLRRHRRKAQKELVHYRCQWSSGSKWHRQFKRLIRQLRGVANPPPLPSHSGSPSSDFLRQSLAQFEKRGRKSTRSLTDLHAFRIQAKRLRYTIEWATPGFKEHTAEKALKHLRRIQNRLGTINDHAVAIEILSQEKRVPKRLLRQEKKLLEQAFAVWTLYWDQERQTKFHALAKQLVEPPPQPELFDLTLEFR